MSEIAKNRQNEIDKVNKLREELYEEERKLKDTYKEYVKNKLSEDLNDKYLVMENNVYFHVNKVKKVVWNSNGFFEVYFSYYEKFSTNASKLVEILTNSEDFSRNEYHLSTHNCRYDKVDLGLYWAKVLLEDEYSQAKIQYEKLLKNMEESTCEDLYGNTLKVGDNVLYTPDSRSVMFDGVVSFIYRNTVYVKGSSHGYRASGGKIRKKD